MRKVNKVFRENRAENEYIKNVRFFKIIKMKSRLENATLVRTKTCVEDDIELKEKARVDQRIPGVLNRTGIEFINVIQPSRNENKAVKKSKEWSYMRDYDLDNESDYYDSDIEDEDNNKIEYVIKDLDSKDSRRYINGMNFCRE